VDRYPPQAPRQCETVDDPHSPVIKGLSTVLRKGAELYRAEAENPETLRIYGKTVPKTGSSATCIRAIPCWASRSWA
jgi:fatty-acid desaturase